MSNSSRRQLYNLAKKINNFYFNGFKDGLYVPFFCENIQVGLIAPTVLKQIQRFPSVFDIAANSVTFTSSLDNATARNAALEKMLLELRKEEVFLALNGWRDECYVTREHFSSQVLFKMDRSATPLFGVRQFGVHITGFVHHSSRGLCVWFQKRSLSKPTWPGMLDSFVGGGITEGLGVLETAIKEAGEEANVPSHLAAHLKPCGSVSFFHESQRGIHPQTEFVFDLELPETFTPSNNDGEVDSWVLVPVAEVPALICDDNFKTTSAAIALDWLIRHGHVTAETEDNFPEIVELLHLPVHLLYSSHNKTSI